NDARACRALVVVLHRRDRVGLESRVTYRRAVPLRHGRGRVLPESHARLLDAGVLAVVSWRVSFSIFAWLGVVWAVVFYRWFRDEPGDHPSVNAAERALLAGNPPVARHGQVPWRRFLGSRTTWL